MYLLYRYVPTIALLTNQEMTDLGIRTVGERAMLCKKCREFEQSVTIVILPVNVVSMTIPHNKLLS